MFLDEVLHRAEMSMQRSTAAWSSASYLRNCAFPQAAYQRLAEKNLAFFPELLDIASNHCTLPHIIAGHV